METKGYKAESIWGSYRKEKVLGAGVYGTVYLATHRTTGKRHAIKKTSGDDDGILTTTVGEMISFLISNFLFIISAILTLLLHHTP